MTIDILSRSLASSFHSLFILSVCEMKCDRRLQVKTISRELQTYEKDEMMMYAERIYKCYTKTKAIVN